MLPMVGNLDTVALYRKYRPGSFGELLGQEQVTVPLSNALDSGRINHAYLFSGPRGCGKTSSARILARSLNCEQGPTSTPCGTCPSCIALAPNGPGTLDVTELDAASHNGVEDMRELRDRAAYAPADSRYRIFIVDEAHMITNQGANALLKVVEEPPAHLIFIFATTEPEKVIPTIRSRVHHYPFRLLTPQSMRTLVERTVASEGTSVEDAVYPLVIRAGGGSPRDTLSVLDQLLAGAGPEGLTYETARMLLGATDDVLIDAAVEALGTSNAAQLYQTVDDVIESGLDPRRFAQDLLDRLRDLMVLQAVPSAFDSGLVDAPTDRADILREQAQVFSGAELPRLAALINDGLSGLKGATSPRLLLEILCAKMLLPSAAALGAGPQVEATAARPSVSGTAQAAPAAQAAASAAGGRPKYERPSVRRAREQAEREAREAAEAKAQLEQKQEEQVPNAVESSANAAEKTETPTPAAAQQPVPVAGPDQREESSSQAENQESAAHQPEEKEVAEASQTEQHDASANVEQTHTEEDTSAVEEAETSAEDNGESDSVVEESETSEAESAPDTTEGNAEESAADDTDAQFTERVRTKWARVLELVSNHDAVAGVLLHGAVVLGFREETIILGHNTRALAERLNSSGTNAVITSVVKAELARDVKVKCQVGTNPEEAGFEPKGQTKLWNPTEIEHLDHTEESEDEQEAQSEPSREAEQQAQAPSVAEPESVAQAEPSETPQQSEPAPQNQDVDDIWGAPAPIGQSLEKPKPLRTEPPQKVEPEEEAKPAEPADVPVPTPETAPQNEDQVGDQGGNSQPQQPEAEPEVDQVPNWRKRAARGAAIAAEHAKHEFSDGAPLPEEPPEWDAPPPPDYQDYSEEPQAPAPAPEPEPEVVEKPQAEAEQAPAAHNEVQQPMSRYQRAKAAAADAVNRPQAPTEPEAPAYSQQEEEDEMFAAASSEPGNPDHRDAMTVAMDLLSEHLGAKRV